MSSKTWRDGSRRPPISREDMDAIFKAIGFVLAGEDPFADDGATVERLEQFRRKIVEWRGGAAQKASWVISIEFTSADVEGPRKRTWVEWASREQAEASASAYCGSLRNSGSTVASVSVEPTGKGLNPIA
jgi:hypothetical protein